MPLLIKSTNGNRTAKVLSSAKDELIESLKGLTFKVELEIKLADIIQSGADTNSKVAKNLDSVKIQPTVSVNNVTFANDARPNSPIKRESVETPAFRLPSKSIPREPSPPPNVPQHDNLNIPSQSSWVEDVRTNSAGEKTNMRSNLPENSDNSTPKRPTSLLMAPPQVERATFTQKVEPVVPAQPIRREPFLPSKGETPQTKPKNDLPMVPFFSDTKKFLKIGSIIDVCCVAVDQGNSPPVAYITRDNNDLITVTDSIKQKIPIIEASPVPATLDIGQEIFAKSIDDDQWYRATIEKVVVNNLVDVYFYDWGLKETLSVQRVRLHGLPQVSSLKIPPLALRVSLVDTSPDLAETFTNCEEVMEAQVVDYDPDIRAHMIKILAIKP